MKWQQWLAAGMVLTGLLAPKSLAAQSVLYVDDDAPAGGDGLTWTTAHRYLQDALAAAAASGGGVPEIRVAQGTYKPDQGAGQTPGSRTATFNPTHVNDLKGGYAGLGQPDPDTRDIAAFKTVLSGDLNGDDQTGGTNAENSYSIFTIGSVYPYKIEGFTITAGNANAPCESANCQGGGMNLGYCGTQVTDCTFEQNHGSAAAAVFITGWDSGPRFLRCQFRDNSAGYGGGALVIDNNSTPRFTDCSFIRNSATHGGVAWVGTGWGRAGPTFTNCLFRENDATGYAGAFYLDSTKLTCTDCEFTSNSSMGSYAGAVFSWKSFVWMDRCRFLSNRTLGSGGVLATDGTSSTTGTMEITNSIFVGNQADFVGVCYHDGRASFKLANCTLVDNLSTEGAAVHLSYDPAELTNCILWGNRNEFGVISEASQVSNSVSITPSINYCIIQDWSGGLGGTGNSGSDPRLVRMPYDGGDGWGVGNNDDFGDLHPGAVSPVIDAGKSDATTTTADLDGKPRRIDDPVVPNTGPGTAPIIDLGAYEYQADCNGNLAVDSVDLDTGASLDCNNNGVPDECEENADCNGNTVQDICDLAAGTSLDCNRNRVPDECDCAGGFSQDSNGDQVPDECERTLTGYWRFDFSMNTGCLIIDRYLTEHRYFRFDENQRLVESWLPTAGQYIKLNFPSVDGPSYNRFRTDGWYTANTNRTITGSLFTPHVGLMQFREEIRITDEDYTWDPDEGSEDGDMTLRGTMNSSGTQMSGEWLFRTIFNNLCGPFTATKLAGPPPALPVLINLEAIDCSLASTTLSHPGAVAVADRKYRVRTSFADAPLRIDYLLSTDSTLDAADRLIGSETISPSSGGQVGLHSGAGPMLSIPECLPWSDGYYVLLVVDAGGAVTETSETDNVFALPVTLTTPALPGDFDGDCDVDKGDYDVFMAAFGKNSGEPGYLAAADFDDDGDVDCSDWEVFVAAWTGPPAQTPNLPACDAALIQSVPTSGRSLPRSARNLIRLRFDRDITAPLAGQLLIREMLPGGTYGADLSAGFTFEVESDAQDCRRVLRIRETGSTLQHRKWYAVLNTGSWTGVSPFTVQYVVQVGDVNNDGRVLNVDFGLVNPAVPSFDVADDDRRDINGDGRILNSDFGVLNSKIPSFPVAKPAGHQ